MRERARDAGMRPTAVIRQAALDVDVPLNRGLLAKTRRHRLGLGHVELAAIPPNGLGRLNAWTSGPRGCRCEPERHVTRPLWDKT